MKIEILCDGCIDCKAAKGKVCQAVSDLNLDVDVESLHTPQKHTKTHDCDGLLRIRIDGLLVSVKNDCSVRDLMLLFNKEPVN